MTRPASRVAPPTVRTAPALAVVVCHDGDEWLGKTLAALRAQTLLPRHVLAVDTGSRDDTRALLDAAADGPDKLLDGVLTLGRKAGFGEAVATAVDHAVRRWGDPGGWVWLLHDDSAPEPDCLATLLTAADVAPRVGVLGPLALDWTDPRLVVEAGLSTDASGHRQTGIRQGELDWSRLSGADGSEPADRFEQSTEVLAVSSAGMLVRRELWHQLDGFDPALPLLRDDIDFGWRANRAGKVVLCVPSARIRHVRAASREFRGVDAGQHPRITVSAPAMDRAAGLRTFLVNCSALSFVLGLPRLTVLCLLRAVGFAMQRRMPNAGAELAALRYLLSGKARLREARRRRSGRGSVRGLFTSRLARLRGAVRRAGATIVRRRIEADAALGRLPTVETRPRPVTEDGRRPVGPDALPAGALPGRGGVRRASGLRRPAERIGVVVPVEAQLEPGLRPSPRPRPSPTRRDGEVKPAPDLVFVDVSRRTVLRQILLAPPLLLFVGLVLLALAAHVGRFGGLEGGRLLPVGDLGRIWSEYLATWHPVAGGTAAPAPAALAVLGSLGALLWPFGGPHAAVGLLVYGDLPLAGLLAYAATRSMPVRRWVRALVAVAYAAMPAATAAVAQSRLDAIVVHILLPPVLAGIAALLVRGRQERGSTAWLSTAAGSAFGLAVIGAFAPLVHLLLVVTALAGFVLVPGHRGDGKRRVAALFAIVLMPLALLLPWPAVVIQHPGVVLQGVGATVPEEPVSITRLIGLAPGGPGAWPILGAVVVLAVLAGLVLRPARAALPGLGVVVLGVGALVLVRSVPAIPLTGGPALHGWSGPALLVIGWGLLWALLGMCRPNAQGLVPVLKPSARTVARVAAVAGAAAVLALCVGAVVPGRATPPRDRLVLASTLTHELSLTQRSVLVLPYDGSPARQSAGRAPEFGDDDFAPTPTTPGRFARLAGQLMTGDKQGVRDALAEATAAGVLFVVLPDRATADRLHAMANDLIADAPATSDGRPVVRMELNGGDAVLLSPELAKRAVSGLSPPSALGTGGIVPVAASPPDLAVRVSDGPSGRLLVVAAEEEPGWVATVGGRQVPVVRAWGHLVAVAVPTRAADVRIEQPTALRSVLLLVQGAMVLFTLLTAIPGRKGR
ncbi:glycosyltransferase family 2 protein [Labedaea rhizosphaerae]|uniref:GT2 family glycosyltransferase n=1 Tax=Labedaea rhizosphaerae TaxID=598644 RepID=A0A4R6S2D1_LABRH|nr:glycosyltransferase family 2 protein [Labedaea rhizosphaerae]TDP93711.1 GT2 family glycosyltransferase [Labedaea rhizosphaerae]